MDLAEYDTYIVGVSGGKDSTAAALWALNNLSNDRVHLVHNPTGASWPETIEHLGYLGKRLAPIVEVRAGDYPLPLRRDGKPRDAWYSAPTLFEMVRGRGRWPSWWQRYCTRYLKQVPIRQYAHSVSGNPLLILGVRAEESRGRARLSQFDLGDSGYRDWVRYRTPVYYPILSLTEREVWEVLKLEGVESNPVYNHVDRCSCWCCPLRSNKAALERFMGMYPGAARTAVDVEVACGHTWRHRQSIGEIYREVVGEGEK